MNEEMALVATIRPQPAAGNIDETRRELLALLPPTRPEAGCLRYELVETNDEPPHWLMLERWSSRAAWQAHMESAHFRAFQQSASALGLLVELAIGSEIGR